MPGTDIETIEQIKNGDRNAFGALVEKYKSVVFAVALHYTERKRKLGSRPNEEKGSSVG